MRLLVDNDSSRSLASQDEMGMHLLIQAVHHPSTRCRRPFARLSPRAVMGAKCRGRAGRSLLTFRLEYIASITTAAFSTRTRGRR